MNARMTARVFAAATLLLVAIPLLVPLTAHAQTANTGEFSLQVTPSPLVTTLKPGTKTELDLKIRNAGTATEDLKIEPRAFSFNSSTGKVDLKDTTPPDVANWVSFSNPTFTVRPGEWFTQKVRISLPKDTGFSYSFALIISRQANPSPTSAGRLIKGSLAVFTLVNVDRPGAVRKLVVSSFKTDKGRYEYLPAEYSVTFKNTGNSIVQPYGNIFIQRGSSDTKPLATLPVNEKQGYLLPGTARTLETVWDGGFPTYKITKNADGTEKRTTVWDWSKVSQFRIGKYTAKLVAVYNDGTRDVPIEQEVSFWVIPWKIIGGFLVVLLLVLFSLYTIVRKIIKLFQRIKNRKKNKQAKASKTTEKPPVDGESNQ